MKLIIYTDNPKYNMHCTEYQVIWQQEGERIQDAFKTILHLPFNENEIKLLINEGKDASNDPGNHIDDIMNFRYNNRCKIGTFLHELSHRIILEYNLLEKAQKVLNIDDVHELIDLFLYDVITELYGESTAKLRVNYESCFEDKIYKNSWEKALSLSFSERQNIISKVIGVDSNEK